MNRTQTLATLIFVILITLQNFVFAGVVRIVANQEGAKLYEVQNGNGVKALQERTFQELKAPWEFEMEETASKLLVMEKPGFMPVYIPIFQGPRNEESSIQVDLKRIDGATKNQLISPVTSLADEMVDSIIYIQQLMDQKKFVEATTQAEALYIAHPQSMSVKLIYANSLMMAQQYARADSLYGSLIDQIPNSMSAMKASIQQIKNRIQGNRKPASAQSPRAIKKRGKR
jgi:hypothetical protein